MAERHASHDLLLVATLAARDVDSAHRPAAEALVAGCPDCAALATDLVAIARATAEMPVPRRPRDFFLSPTDAERLRPRGLRRLAAASGRPWKTARPLAGGLMMLGFAGLLVASLPGVGQLGGATSAQQRLELAGSPAPDSAIQGEPLMPYASEAPASSDTGDVRGAAGQGASAPPVAEGAPGASASAPAPAAGPEVARTARDATAGPSPLVVGSVALIAIGAVLFVSSMVGLAARRP